MSLFTRFTSVLARVQVNVFTLLINCIQLLNLIETLRNIDTTKLSRGDARAQNVNFDSCAALRFHSGYQGSLVGERRLADSLALEPRVQQRKVFLSCFCSLYPFQFC